jgi:hypothetical protein
MMQPESAAAGSNQGCCMKWLQVLLQGIATRSDPQGLQSHALPEACAMHKYAQQSEFTVSWPLMML